MLDQLKESMGEGKAGGEQPAPQPGKKPGEQAGEGSGGTTDKENEQFGGDQGSSGTRTLEKKSGTTASKLPSEYQKIIDAYNKTESP